MERLALILWLVAAALFALSMAAMTWLVVSRLLRDRALRRRDEQVGRLRGMLIAAVAGEQPGEADLSIMRTNAGLIATLLVEIGELIRGEDSDRLFAALEKGGVFEAIAMIAANPKARRRLVCIEAVGLFPGARASLILRAARRDPNPAIRFAAANGLVERGGVVSLARLIEGLRSVGDHVSKRAADIIERQVRRDPRSALRTIGGQELTASARALILQGVGASGDCSLIADLVPWARHPDSETRTAAVTALGAMKHPSAEPFIVGSLDDEDAGVRRAAIRAIGLGGFVAQAEALTGALADPNWTIRFEAARALAAMAEAGAARLRAAARDDRSPTARDLAAATLAEMATA